MSTFSRVFLSAAVLLMLLAGPARAAEAETALQGFLDRVDSLQAQFTQTQSDEAGKTLQTSTGQMWLQRGKGGGAGRFRWNYAQPYEQQIVCDGSRIWLYDPDLAQVTVRPAEEALKGTPAALLSQGARLREAFVVEDGGRDGKVQKIRMKPKAADSEFRGIELWLDGELPVRLRFTDPLGGSSDIRFSGLKSNASLKASLFDFTPPKGVEVVDGSAP